MTTRLPRSVSDWQLYSGMKGVGQVVRELTMALSAVGKAIRRGESGNVERGNLWRIMDEHRSYGARDTEPREVAMAYIEAVQLEGGV
jgi:hypothetical protein